MMNPITRRKEDDDETKGMRIQSHSTPNNNFNLYTSNNFIHKINTIQKQHQYHLYHTTTKKEILPLIAVGSLAVVGVYSFKALKRMDEEWEEYEEALREYKLEHGLSDEDMENIMDTTASTTTKNEGDYVKSASRGSSFEQGRLAIDLGSVNIRIAHYNDKKNTNTKPKIVVNREGSRSTPNSIIVETDGSIVSGKMAASKIYERSQSNNPVLNPYQLLSSTTTTSNNNGSETTMTMKYAVQNAISSLAKDALEQVVGRNDSSNAALFSIDSNNGYNTQPIFTYPPPKTEDVVNNKDDSFLELYQDATYDLMSPSSIAKFIPEPICAVKGARYHNLIPSVSSGSSLVMVVDVGGETTSISIIDESQMNNNQSHSKSIQYHTRLNEFGGEIIVESIMNYLSKSFYGSSIDKVSDTMGVQRLYDSSQSAAMEIGGSKYGRVQINIPYLSVDEKMQPKHLDLGLSANVVKAELNDLVQTKIIPNIAMEQGVLSNVMNKPNDLESLLSSMIMNVLEKSGHNPFTLNSVLVIGGGARSPFIRDAFKTAFGQLAGDQFVQDKVVIPTDALVEEMVILGAALSSDD